MEKFQIIDLTVLYVEDEETVAKVTFDILQKIVKKVYLANNGLEGLEKFKEIHENDDQYNNIDIVLTDINMPIMNGFEMLLAMRELSPDLRAIILTGHAASGDFFELASGLDVLNDYLMKPIELSILIHRLKINEKKIINKKEYLKLQKLHNEYELAINEKMLVSKTDKMGIITHVNDKFCEISGYAREELLGKPHNIIKSEKTSPKVFKKLWETITQHHVYDGIMINRTKDGEDFVCDTTVLPLVDIHGNIQEYISIRTDITSYAKKRDEEMIKMQEKTLMLFTHELKSPLNSIIAFNESIVDFLSTGITDTKVKMMTNFSKIIGASAKQLSSIITTLLDLSKLKSNKLKFNLEKFDLVALINEKIEVYKVIHKREVQTVLPASLFVYLDLKSIEHIVENLLTNSLKYSSSKVLIEVAIDNNFIIFSVDDDGEGIAEENREVVFNMFTQESEGRNIKEKGGTGVGLHLVKLLCENNHFEVKIDTSMQLGGASFKVKIPLDNGEKNV